MDAKFTADFNHEIRCPYCRHEIDYSNEIDDDMGTHDCAKCDKTFHFTRVVEVNYRSAPDCSLNGEQHNFIPRLGHRFCSVCDKLEFVDK
jgi:DNA-directed RNA polymerase subunit RPC12/RpoP